MEIDTAVTAKEARETRIFTLVVGCLMVGLIMFGVLELMDVFRI